LNIFVVNLGVFLLLVADKMSKHTSATPPHPPPPSSLPVL
jgi:hypothetical protein